jgi:hypothetical protein
VVGRRREEGGKLKRKNAYKIARTGPSYPDLAKQRVTVTKELSEIEEI